ncbi:MULTISPECIES: TetR/AcrR family transcriptional regulator [Enterobacteriaceae]|uniref:TetR/AcrR family transcriptional regulator n=1 Tax=Enterobacteriaceae TaxID=543 RepID=UPI000DA48BE3|nr:MULTISPECIES: TetR/AcrR family transcriptional regulator [Enterobacteriaceae]EFH7886076.1 TetR family transcriptional regulator [Escherichia coli]EIV7933817.1 TetR/AcrR family transcriptional regulator [Klebsiella pneumoniae]QMC33019.1 TetR/AcrR family transcriptional regulator [Klebsiella pneumoniae]SQY57124.1 putative HTH-type transcriptional regulator [Escherichia coli]HBW3482255.1 TetR/AcrR family transcriptional regulator [Klebsiella pneumoniae]
MGAMGRPRTFDREKAIEDAMYLFWQHGYESTSLAQLKAGIRNGISAPSFYAAFGSKEALFQECVQRYLATFGQVTNALWDNTLPAREALEVTLRSSAEMQCEPGHPSGCMVGLGSLSATSAQHASVAEPLIRSRDITREGITATIQRGIDRGELSNNTDIIALAGSFSTFLFGLSIQARDGATLEEFNSAISLMMRLWDTNAA